MKPDRLEVANKACGFFIPDTTLHLDKGRVFVSWTSGRGKIYQRMWQSRNGSFYPTWSSKWGHGGTSMTALAQLVFFARDLNCLPISTWEYWCSPTVLLCPKEENKNGLLACLRGGGYPLVATCIFCGKSPIGRFDWYSGKGYHGGTGCLPGCEAWKRFSESRSKSIFV